MSQNPQLQYATLKYLPDAVTGEFVNIGLVAYCPGERFFEGRLLMSIRRLTRVFPGADGDLYRKYVGHLQRKIDLVEQRIVTDQMSIVDRPPEGLETLLNQILVPDDSSLRFDDVKRADAPDIASVFEYLYERLVARYLVEPTKESRSDEQIWQVYRRPLQARNILAHLAPKKIATKYETFDFEHAAKNGAWHVLQPVSFDSVNAGHIRNKARQWLSAVQLLNDVEDLGRIYILLGRPSNDKQDVLRAYRDARNMLVDRSANLRVSIFEESQADTLAKELAPVLTDH